MIDFKPLRIEGKLIQLIPLQKEHKDSLLASVEDGNLWKLWYTSVPSSDTINEYINTALDQKNHSHSIPFVVIDKKSGVVIGTTRYCNVDQKNRRLEIGYTWYSKSYQKTGANTECKYLLLKHAFESFDTIAVEFRTHWHNHSSRNAILRLGAKQDGVLRSHRVNKEGQIRDTVVFSIIQSEWAVVKKSLEHKMNMNYSEF